MTSLLLVLALGQLASPPSPQTWAKPGSAAPYSVQVQNKPGSTIDVNIASGGGTGGGPSDTAPNTSASESDTARQKTSTTIRVLDTGQSAGSQLVTAKGDQTSGLWVNCKAGCSAAGDTTGSQQTLNALNGAATVALAGENSIAVQLTSSTSPVFAVVGECSLDGGASYGNTLTFVSSTGTTATSLTNPANATYSLLLPPGCSGATNARVRVSAYTSGSVVAQLRATSNSPGSAPYAGAIGTTSYPPAALAIMAQDSSTASTSRAVKANANGVLVDGSGVTQPVSAASLPLPTGAATAAKQPALGTAGSASADVLTVQGIASMTALKTDGSGVTQPISGSVSISGTPTVNPGNTANTTPWLFKLNDGTNSVAIKAASTAAAATDPALVVAVSPNNSVAVTGTFWQATQPVSGTVTATQGTAASASGGWPVKVTDGTSVAAVKAASTAATATDPAAVVSLSPNSPLPAGTNVIGALSANQSVNLAQVAGGTVTTIATGEQKVGVEGPAANGATISGNPVSTGLLAVTPASAPSTISAGQIGYRIGTTDRIPYVAAYHPNGFHSGGTCASISAATQCMGLSGSGQSYYITSITFSASAAISFTVTSSTTAGNACATSPTTIIGSQWFPANGGAPFVYPEPIRVTANSALCCTPSGASGTCTITGFIAP